MRTTDHSRPHWGIVVGALALFLWGCAAAPVPLHLESQGWRLATLWAVRPAAEFKESAVTLDCRGSQDSQSAFALTAYRSNHRGWVMLLPAGAVHNPQEPRFVYVRPGLCEAPIDPGRLRAQAAKASPDSGLVGSAR